MRLLPKLLLLGAVGLFTAQSEAGQLGWTAQAAKPTQEEQSLFTSLVPEASISIEKHPMGADMVEITMAAAGYPPKLLKEQVGKLAAYFGCEPNGLQIWDYAMDPDSAEMHFTKATFSLQGVIDRQAGTLRLNPFAKAFAGAAAPWTVHSLELNFHGETPSRRMVRIWRSDAAVVEGRLESASDPRLSGIDYRIRLLAQDSKRMDIPEPRDFVETRRKKVTPPQSTDWTVTAVFVIAAGAVGALVYSLLLKGRPRARSF